MNYFTESTQHAEPASGLLIPKNCSSLRMVSVANRKPRKP